MINQRFMPEGWEEKASLKTDEQLRTAIQTGEILQAKVSRCDNNYNLYVDLGNNIKGVIPREEVEAINVDETGFPKPNICTSKVNKLVQFKVKNIDSKNNFILSIVLGITSGIMLHLSLFELIPNSLKYKNYLNTFIGFILGFIIMIICIFIFKI